MRSLALLLVSVCLPLGASHAAEVTAPRAAELENMVLQDCGSCHGLTRKGGLGPDIRAKTLADYAPEGLAGIIKYGIDDTPMPPWGPLLSDDEISWIAEYLLKETTE